MLSPFTIILWLSILVGAVVAVAVHFFLDRSGGSLSLVDLRTTARPTGGANGWLPSLQDSLAGVDWEPILFGALTLIGALLILRALVSAVVVLRQRKFRGAPLTSPVNPTDRSGSSAWHLFGHGLSGKMLVALTGTVALFGFCTVAVVYFTLTKSLREHELKRAAVLALNVSDAAASYMVANKTAGLVDLVRKANANGAPAYLVVEDRKGAVAAHSLSELPDELRPKPDRQPVRREQRRTLSIGGRAVYETAVPMLDGQAGAVRVGLWAQDVDSEIARTVTPVIMWVLAIFAGGLLCSIYLVWQINRPIVRLVQIASQISHGRLDMPLSGTRAPGEFGELSRALERLRSSVKAAMSRLD